MAALAYGRAAQVAYDNQSPDESDDAAWEAREDFIESATPTAAKLLMVSPDFAWTAMAEQPDAILVSFAEDLGNFFERYHAGNTDTELAQAGYALYRTLKPYVEAAAEAQARLDVADDYDRQQADAPRSHAEARAAA